MKVEETFIDDVYILEPQVFEDHRGTFYESYNKQKLEEINFSFQFVQDNESYNKKRGTIRGLHLQIKQAAQTKLIRVSQGKIYGVCVDLRKSSSTYKKYYAVELSSDNHKQIIIPRGCAWGFQTLVDDTIVCYKLDNLYNGDYERGISYQDPELQIDWPIKDGIVISEKDAKQVIIDNFVTDVLITGANGQLGYDVCNLLKNTKYNVVATTKEELNVCNAKEVENYITQLHPDVIINCAAYTDVEKSEQEESELCYNVNVEGTRNLIWAARKVNAKFIYISSDYVFDGNKNDPYNDLDKPNPKNYYGITKLLGEEITRTYPKHFIVRTSWLFGVHGKNFVKSMLNLSKKQDKIFVVDDQIGSPTYSNDLAKMIIKMMLTNKYGTYNVTNTGYCSWNEFANTIFQTANIDMNVKKISTKDYKKKTNQLVDRPLSSKLNKSHLIQEFEKLPNWQDALQRFMEELNDYEKKQD